MLYKLENDPINQNKKKQKYKQKIINFREDLDFLVNIKNQKKIEENIDKYHDKELMNKYLNDVEKVTIYKHN